MSVTVEIISAPWCKRCHTVKPDVAATCALVGATLTYVEFDDLDEAAQAAVTSLPTIRMRVGADENGWTIWTANTLAEWATAIMATASVAPSATDTDF
jgi:hypothetical protein